MRFRLLFLSLLLVFFAGVVSARQSPRTVRIGAFNYYPAIFKAEDGSVQGFYVDILAEIAQRENWQIEYVYGNWDEGLQRLKSGKIDLLTSVARTPERETFMDFGAAPLLTVWGELYVSPGSNILGVRDVAGKRVAVMRRDFNAQSFRHLTGMLHIDCTFVEVDDFDAVFAAIENGAADAGVVNSTYGSAKHQAAKVISSGVIFNPFDIFFTARKGRHADLLRTLDGYLSTWHDEKNSPYHQAIRRWGHGTQATAVEIPVWLTTTLWFLLAAVVLGGSFIFALRREVRRATCRLTQRERHLEQSEGRYRGLFENSPISLWEEDLTRAREYLETLREQGVADLGLHLEQHPEIISRCTAEIRICDINQATVELYEAQDKDELLANLQHTLTEESHKFFAEQLIALWAGETSLSMEVPVKTLAGKPLRVLVHWQVMPGHEKKFDRILISLLDITERTEALQQARRALRAEAAAKSQLHALLHAVSNGIIVTDSQNKIVLLNPAAEKFIGIGQEALGKTLREAKAHSDLIDWLRAGELPRPTPGLLTLTNPQSGNTSTVQVQGFTSEPSSGALPGTIVTLRDITREKESDRLKSIFIATAAHELRTPLTSILGFTELLQNLENPSKEALQEYVEIIHRRGEALQHIIDDLLDISRVETGHLVHLEKIPCDLVELLQQLETSFTQQFGNYDISFNLPDTAEPALIDPHKIRQAVENLLSNAVKFSPPGSRITLRADKKPGAWEIAVTDNGIGLSQEQAERVFDRFYRVDTSNTAKQGLGLGMSIARAIVEAHGGHIRIDSRVGVGTTVTLTLPDEQS